MERRTPNEGHHRLVAEVHATLDRYEQNGIPVIEQIVLLSQIIGQKISDLSPIEYDVPPVLNAVLRNIVEGNERARGDAPIIGVPGHG